MAEKTKSINIGIIVIAIIVVLAIGFGIYKVVEKSSIKNAKSSSDIVINDRDSDQLKKEKINKKIELINKEIEKIQADTQPELEKINKLYEEYVSAMNESQTSPVEE